MSFDSFPKKYTARKVLISEKGFSCYLAEKKDENSPVLVLVNEIKDRQLINNYIQEIVSLEQKDMAAFIEYFSEDSKFYTVFSYQQGMNLKDYLSRENLNFDERLLLFYKIILELTKYPAISTFLKTTALFPENIVLYQDSVAFRFCFMYLYEELTEKNTLYFQINGIMDLIFSDVERNENPALHIVWEKCGKMVYRSLGEILKDLDIVRESLQKEKDIKEKLLQKKAAVKRLAQKAGIFVVVIAVGVYAYQKWSESKAAQTVYVDVEKIGSVNVGAGEEEFQEIEKIYVGEQKEIKPEKKANEIDQEKTVQSEEKDLLPKKEEEEEGWLIDENGIAYQIHIVSQREYLVDICKTFYGEENYSYADVLRVIEYNSLKNPNVIVRGQEIKLPKKE